MQDVQSTMQQAVGSAVPHTHRHLVDQAVSAFEERDYSISDNLLGVATSKGLSESEARQIVEGAGLALRPAPPVEVAASNGSSVNTDAALAAASKISEAAQELVAALGGISGRN